MRKRVFGSIFLTSLVTLLLTTGLLLLAVHAGLTNDMRQRLVTESSYLSAVDNIREELEKFGSVYADRLTLVAQDGTVLYDNRTNASEMENHAVRPEIAAAEKNGTGEDNRLSETFSKQTFYYAVRLKNGDVLRISATADSVFGALSNASPWIVLIILLALLVAALLAGWLTGLFLKPIEALDLHDPMKGEAYDELSPLLHRMDKQNHKIQAQMDELQRRQAEFDDITARMDEGLVLFSGKGMILFANHAARALFPHDSAEGSYLTLCRDANYIQVVEQALDGKGAHGKLERDGRIYELTASSVEENSAWHAAVLLIVDITERERAEQQRQEFTANVSHELRSSRAALPSRRTWHRLRARSARKRSGCWRSSRISFTCPGWMKAEKRWPLSRWSCPRSVILCVTACRARQQARASRCASRENRLRFPVSAAHSSR